MTTRTESHGGNMTARTDAEIQARDELLAEVDRLVSYVVRNRARREE